MPKKKTSLLNWLSIPTPGFVKMRAISSTEPGRRRESLKICSFPTLTLGPVTGRYYKTHSWASSTTLCRGEIQIVLMV